MQFNKMSNPKYGTYYVKQYNMRTKKLLTKIKKCKTEQYIISLINMLYWGDLLCNIHKIMFEITGIKHEIYNICNNEKIEKIEHNDLSTCVIANFLNENKILRRNKKWTDEAITNIVLESKKN